jgi:hypothetical protein
MLDASNTQSENDITGRSRPEPGRYHVAIQNAAEKGSKKKGTPGLELEFQVICDGLQPDGKTPTEGQANKTIPLFLSYIGGDDTKTKTCLDRVLRLALACGIMQPGEAKEPNWDEAMGRELVIEVEAEQYDDEKSGQVKVGSQVAFLGFWSLGNKQVANVPKDATSPGMQQLAKQGGLVQHPTASPTGGQATQTAGQATTTQPIAQTTAAGATASPTKRKWANL